MSFAEISSPLAVVVILLALVVIVIYAKQRLE